MPCSIKLEYIKCLPSFVLINSNNFAILGAYSCKFVCINSICFISNTDIDNCLSLIQKVSFNSDVTLQKLVNRTVERYVSDESFRIEMNEYAKLQISGSQF